MLIYRGRSIEALSLVWSNRKQANGNEKAAVPLHEICFMYLIFEGLEFLPCPFSGSTVRPLLIRASLLSLPIMLSGMRRLGRAPSNSFIGSPPIPWSSTCTSPPTLRCQWLRRSYRPPLHFPLKLYIADLRRGESEFDAQVTVRDEVESDHFMCGDCATSHLCLRMQV